MRPLLLLICVFAAVQTGCAREAAPAASASAAPQASDAASPTPAVAAPTDPAALSSQASAAVTLVLSGEGLDFVSERGSVRHFLFDTPSTDAIAAVTRVQDGSSPQRGRNEECGAGPLDMATWPDGLTVVSQDGRFVGWSVSRRVAAGAKAGPATMAGIGFGSTRRELEAAYAADIRETTLGQEFAAGGIFGVLDGSGQSARITALWAGASCNFR